LIGAEDEKNSESMGLAERQREDVISVKVKGGKWTVGLSAG